MKCPNTRKYGQKNSKIGHFPLKKGSRTRKTMPNLLFGDLSFFANERPAKKYISQLQFFFMQNHFTLFHDLQIHQCLLKMSCKSCYMFMSLIGRCLVYCKQFSPEITKNTDRSNSLKPIFFANSAAHFLKQLQFW